MSLKIENVNDIQDESILVSEFHTDFDKIKDICYSNYARCQKILNHNLIMFNSNEFSLIINNKEKLHVYPIVLTDSTKSISQLIGKFFYREQGFVDIFNRYNFPRAMITENASKIAFMISSLIIPLLLKKFPKKTINDFFVSHHQYTTKNGIVGMLWVVIDRSIGNVGDKLYKKMKRIEVTNEEKAEVIRNFQIK